MFIASTITLIGAIVQASAEKKRDLIAGRIILGIGTVMLGPSAQSYAVGSLHLFACGLEVESPGNNIGGRLSEFVFGRNGASSVPWCNGRCIPGVLLFGHK